MKPWWRRPKPKPDRQRTRREIANAILADPTRLDRDGLTRLKQFDIVAFNRNSEKAFRHRLTQMLTITPVMAISTVIQELSYDLDISPETAKRYVYKHTASRAPFCIREGGISLRNPPKEGE